MTDKDELEEIRRKKMEKLKEQAEQERQDTEEQNQEQSLDVELRKFLTSNARQRLKTAELAKPELVKQVKKELVQAYKMNKIKQELDEEDIKQILSQANEQTSQSFNIKRR